MGANASQEPDQNTATVGGADEPSFQNQWSEPTLQFNSLNQSSYFEDLDNNIRDRSRMANLRVHKSKDSLMPVTKLNAIEIISSPQAPIAGLGYINDNNKNSQRLIRQYMSQRSSPRNRDKMNDISQVNETKLKILLKRQMADVQSGQSQNDSENNFVLEKENHCPQNLIQEIPPPVRRNNEQDEARPILGSRNMTVSGSLFSTWKTLEKSVETKNSEKNSAEIRQKLRQQQYLVRNQHSTQRSNRLNLSTMSQIQHNKKQKKVIHEMVQYQSTQLEDEKILQNESFLGDLKVIESKDSDDEEYF